MNTNSFSNSYKEAGVDVTAGYKAVELMKQHVARTMTSGVLSGIGGFGGLFELDMTGITKPVLVSGTDGVGTKLKIAFLSLFCLFRILFPEFHCQNHGNDLFRSRYRQFLLPEMLHCLFAEFQQRLLPEPQSCRKQCC